MTIAGEASDACLKCTQCISACPVYREDPDFPGPKRLGPEWWRGWQGGDRSTLSHVDDCTFCQLCEAACPADVPVAHLIARHKEARRVPTRLRMRNAVLSRPDVVARFPWFAAVRGPWDNLLGMARTSRRPRVRRPSHPGLARPGAPLVGIFVDCYSGAFDGGTVDAVESLLNAWGYLPIRLSDGRTCCGAAAQASGLPTQARDVARITRSEMDRQMTKAGRSLTAIITLNATCDGTLWQEWPGSFGLEPWSCPILPFTDFALQFVPDAFWANLVKGDETRVWTHTTCRSRVHRGEGSLDELVRRMGVEPRSLDLSCCGAAGSYAFKAEHEEVAHRMGKQAVDPDMRPGDRLFADSGTCALHLGQMTGLKTGHPAEWIWERAQHSAWDRQGKGTGHGG